MAARDEVFISVLGTRELKQTLASLPRVGARRAIRKGTRAAAKVILPEARSQSPKGKTKQLSRAIRVRAAKRRRSFIGAVVVLSEKFFKGDGQFYGAFEEFGWKAGKRGVRRRRQVEGKHFMEKAAKSKGRAAKNVAQVTIVAELDKETRLARRR